VNSASALRSAPCGIALPLILTLSSCVAHGPAQNAADPGASGSLSDTSVWQGEIDRLATPAVDARQKQLSQLFQHWTQGTALAEQSMPFDETKALASLERVRELAKKSGADQKTLRHLENWFVSELLTHRIRDDEQALSALEASLTARIDSQEIALRDLPSALINEKSALRRKAYWKATQPLFERLAEAQRRKEEHSSNILASLGIPSALQWASELRDTDLDLLERGAEWTLSQTKQSWRAALERQLSFEVRLALASATRADLPRAVRAPPGVDALFPKVDIVSRSLRALDLMQLKDRPHIDASEGISKNPLPLTLEFAPIKSSIKPQGGLRDQSAVLFEVGYAMALHQSVASPVNRLMDPFDCAHASGMLFASLLAEPQYLEDIQVPADKRQLVIDSVKSQRILAMRRGAGSVLARLKTHGLEEAELKKVLLETADSAFSLNHDSLDAPRLRSENDFLLREATRLKSLLVAEMLRGQLKTRFGEAWWRLPAAGLWLNGLWRAASCETVGLFSKTAIPVLASQDVDAQLIGVFEQPQPASPDAGFVPVVDAGR
jgi:hypothetical protein